MRGGPLLRKWTRRAFPSARWSHCATRIRTKKRPTQYWARGTATPTGTLFRTKPPSARRCSGTSLAKLSPSIRLNLQLSRSKPHYRTRPSKPVRLAKRPPSSRRSPSDFAEQVGRRRFSDCFAQAPLHQQFIGENAQAINGGGFHAQNNRSQGNPAARIAAGKRKLRRREITFRPDKHQYAFLNMSMFAGIICENFF